MRNSYRIHGIFIFQVRNMIKLLEKILDAALATVFFLLGFTGAILILAALIS